jgi:hypothetical protein
VRRRAVDATGKRLKVGDTVTTTKLCSRGPGFRGPIISVTDTGGVSVSTALMPRGMITTRCTRVLRVHRIPNRFELLLAQTWKKLRK